MGNEVLIQEELCIAMNGSPACTNKAGPVTEQNKAIELQEVKGMCGILMRPPC